MSQSWTLRSIGWTDERQSELERTWPSSAPARVAAQHSQSYELLTEPGQVVGRLPGRLRHQAHGADGIPAVGDWVAIRMADHETALIEGVLERKSALSRKVAGLVTAEQVIASNIDVLFIVSALDQDLNLRRIERYLSIAWQSGALPAIVLTKSDWSEDPAAARAEVAAIAPGLDLFVTSTTDEESIDKLGDFIRPGTTVAFVGSSGVGKSTLINLLAKEEVMPTAELRKIGKGRHTTTHRQLLPLLGRAAVIDTPGMRELQLWDISEGIASTFEDIEELAQGCRFTDCSHLHEPGCAVKEAIALGSLDEDRLSSWHKQLREQAAMERKRDVKLAREHARRVGDYGRDAKKRARHR